MDPDSEPAASEIEPDIMQHDVGLTLKKITFLRDGQHENKHVVWKIKPASSASKSDSISLGDEVASTSS